jgi:hypothetical protein
MWAASLSGIANIHRAQCPLKACKSSLKVYLDKVDIGHSCSARSDEALAEDMTVQDE